MRSDYSIMAPMVSLAAKEAKLSPPLKWAGGKRWLVPHLEPFWQQHKNYRLVEPFCGGLAVALGLNPQKALLNDINEHLIHFYQWLQKGLVITRELRNQKTFFYEQRKRFNQLIHNGKSPSKEAAEIFYYLNRTGYNGLCRFNSRGEFNVPFGKYKTINYQSDFRPYVDVLKPWEFSSVNFEDLRLKSRDFVYADPPYDVEFRQYSKNGFAWKEQVRLAEWLTEHRGPVLLSNQATRRIVDLYDKLGYELLYLDGPRRISCNGDRTAAKEVLAIRGL